MAFRIMFDSVDPTQIPTTAELVAGYVNGSYKWSEEGWALFPNAGKLTINVTGDAADGGQALDVENYDATPADAPVWFDARTKAGATGLVIYCNRSTLPAVEAAMGPDRGFYRWIATLDGTLAIPGFTPFNGPAAVQFAGSAQAGRNVDVSLVVNDGLLPSPSLAQVKAAMQSTANEAVTALSLVNKYALQV
jgi:hypothetical protein